MDCSHLKGKKIKNGTEYIGFDSKWLTVSEIDFEVGLTIHVGDDVNHRAYCLVHPEIFAKKMHIDRDDIDLSEEEYNWVFMDYVEMIEHGILTDQWHERHFSRSRGITGYSQGTMSSMCPFK